MRSGSVIYIKYFDKGNSLREMEKAGGKGHTYTRGDADLLGDLRMWESQV